MLSWKHFIFFLLLFVIVLLYPYTVFSGRNVFFGILVLLYLVAQISYATINYRDCKKLVLPPEPPSVVFLVVGYRENEGYWEKCLKSILTTEYANVAAVVAMIDGCDEDDRYMADIFQQVMLEENRFESVVRLCQHKGKRFALEAGYRHVLENFPQNDYIIVMDSDTIIRPDSVGELVKCIHADEKNGCATGSLLIFNTESLLAKIVNARYMYAFTIERGAQSAVGVMTCCSGPFSIYRQSCINNDFLDKFVNEKFCGQQVHPGDDRALTCILLEQGWKSRQSPFAVALTETPDSLLRYLKQQARWSRSYIRCCSSQIRAIGNQHIYLLVLTIYEILFPLLVVVSFFPTFNIISQNSHRVFMERIFVAIGVLLFRTFVLTCFHNYDICKTIYNLLVFPVYFLWLLPIKMYAWCTPWVQGWLTSSRKSIFSSINLDVVLIYLSVLIWDTALALCIYFRFTQKPLFGPIF